MPVWTAEQLSRFSRQGEDLFNRDCKCIIDRISLNIQSGVSLYVLPEQVIDIRRVTYRGIRVYPVSHRTVRRHLDGTDSNSRPTTYAFDNLGQMTIKLIPTPVESLAQLNTNLFSPSVIRETCIIEYYAMPDGISYKLPEVMRRRLLKAYVLKQAFSIESKGQNLKAAKYWASKWEYLKEVYTEKVEDLIVSPRKLLASNLDWDLVKRTRIPQPTLPMNMIGIGVDIEDEY